MKKKSNIWIILSVIMIVVAMVLVGRALTRSFDAKAYVASVLDLTYHGKVDKAANIMEGVTEEELCEQYEAGVVSFVKGNILSGVETTEEEEAKFIALGKQIFDAMKYEVRTEHEVASKHYEVTVTYEPSNVFKLYVTYVQEKTQEISDKVEAGEYKGTVEEINAQMEKEFMDAAYSLLEQAYNNMEYGEAEEMIFNVKAEESDLYQLDSEELRQLMIKIMGLDQIQD